MKLRLVGFILLGIATGEVAFAQEALPPPVDSLAPPISQPRSFASPPDSGAFPFPNGNLPKGLLSQEVGGPSQPPPGPNPPMTQPAADATPSTAAHNDAAEALHDDHIGPDESFWFRGAYLLWWFKSGPLPVPVVTTGSTTGRGALDQPDTTVLFGNSKFNYENFNGFLLESGLWLDEHHYWGLEAGGFLFEKKSTSNEFSSDVNGNPVLARPATNTLTSMPFGFLVSSPSAFSGSIAISSSARLWGLNVDLVRNLAATPRFRADLICGFQYLDLGENLTFSQNSTVLTEGAIVFNGVTQPSGSVVNILDQFQTRNRVYGGQIGGRFEFYRDSWFIGAITKVSLGPNQQSLDISGSTTVTPPGGAAQSAMGGFLALNGTNIGMHSTNWFVIVPQVSLQLGYQLSDHILVHVAYDFLFINDVVRPGNAVNPNINPTFLPTSSTFGAFTGLPQPRVPFREEDFWAHGVEFGLELRF